MKKALTLTLVLMFFAEFAFSQAAPNSSGIFEEVGDVPINGAIAALAFFGIGFGAKKLYARKK